MAREQNGVRGGIFVDRAGALKFARFENGSHPHAVVWVNGILELNISAAPASAPEELRAQRVRRVA